MKKVLIGAIIGALFLAGVSLYLMFRPAPVPEMVGEGQNIATNEKNKEPKPEPFSGTESIFNVLKRGGTYECSLTFDVNEGVPTATEGTFFVRGNLLRSDYVTTVGEMEVLSSTIVRDGYVYSWTTMEGATQGIKIKADLSAPEVEGAVAAKEMESLKSDVKYDCKPWATVDNSVFELPADVLFRDFEEIMNVGMEYGNTFEAADQCASCGYLSGEAKAQCLKALACE
jgi:hypothetical protein